MLGTVDEMLSVTFEMWAGVKFSFFKRHSTAINLVSVSEIEAKGVHL